MRRIITFLSSLFVIFSAPQETLAQSEDSRITFLARESFVIPNSLVGHAFFCIETRTTNNVKEECFGFYPESMDNLFGGRGRVSNEFRRDDPTNNPFENISTSVSHSISESTRQAIYEYITSNAGQNYDLIIQNCGDFIFQIARISGLQTPNRSTVLLPSEFVDGLRELYWSGRWLSTDARSRFQVNIENSSVTWIERDPAGKKLETTSLYSVIGSGIRITRENTDAVLDFLGFQAATRAEILAGNPRPSYIDLQRRDGTIVGQWYGLSVTKDSRGRIQEIRQPGSRPPTEFVFDRLP